MDSPSATAAPGRTWRIPPYVWAIAIAGLLAALAAIFVFKVAAGTVLTYAFFGLMMLSHLFMHGGHAGHGPAAETQKAADDSNDSHAGHSGGCH